MKVPPEERLLLLLVQPKMDKGELRRMEELAREGLNWPRLWKLAVQHSVTPLLHRGFSRLDDTLVPKAMRTSALRTYQVNALRNALRYEVLEQMLAALQAAHIPVVILKGAALAATVYPNPALRVWGDVDLLVRPEHLASAHAVLAAIPHNFLVELAADHPDFRDHFLVESLGKWRMPSPDWQAIWRYAVPVKIVGVRAWVPTPTHHLLLLCANFVRRNLTLLKLLVDIAEIAHHYRETLAWDAVLEEARRWGLARWTWYVFRLVQRGLAVSIPPALLEPPSDLRLSRLEMELLVFKEEYFLQPLPLGFLLIFLNGGSFHKAKALWDGLVPSRRRLAHVYGLPADSRWTYLYYPRWPFDLLARYGPSLLRLIATSGSKASRRAS